MTNTVRRAGGGRRRQDAYLAALEETVLGLISHLDVTDLLVEIVRRAGVLVGTSHGYIYLLAPGGTELEMRVGLGVYSEFVSSRVKPGEGVSGKVWKTGQPVVVDDHGSWPGRLSDAKYDMLRGTIGMPLKSGAQVVGVIGLSYVEEERKFGESEVEILNRFAHLASVALENARLYAALQTELAERQRVEAQLRLQATVLESAANGIVITDREGIIRWVNPAFTRMTGYTAEEAMGQNPRLIKSGKHDNLFYQNLWESVLAGRVWHGETVNRRKDGSLYIEEQTITPVHDEQGQMAYFVAVKQDITERKQAEAEVQKAKEAAEAANKAKSTFLANMSHELRTPLNHILGYSEILLEEAARDHTTRAFLPDLQKIRTAGKHLLGLINDILAISKIEAGKMDLHLQTFDVARMVEEVVTTIRPLAEKNENALTIGLTDHLGAMRSDQSKIRQALFNLLDNASKFTRQGRISLEAVRTPLNGADWLIFRVSDTGIGITAEQMARVFQAFIQVDDSTTRRFGGTGLGLAITRRFCQMLGGDITLTSEAGKGSTFTIRLPAEAPGAEAGRSSPPSAGAVLVIDDELAVRDWMKRFLNAKGFRAEAVSGGEEGLRLAQELHPEAIVLDAVMADMDGWAVLAALKADPDLARIPVIMLTSAGRENLSDALGASDHLTKPVDRERLIRSVTASLQRSRE